MAAAKTVVVISASGGAGATTIAVNLACALPQHVGGRVLLLDAHYPIPGEGAAVLDVAIGKAAGEMVPVLPRLTSDQFASSLASHPSGVAVLPLISDAHQARHVTRATVRTVFELARRSFGAIVVDAGWPSLVSDVVFDHADVVCLVVEASSPSLQRARAVLEFLRTLHVGKDATVVCINRLLPRGSITAEFAQSYLQTAVVAGIPNDATAVQQAAAKKQVIFLSNPKHAISREVDRLARTVAVKGLRAAQAAKKADPETAAARVREMKVRLHRRLVQEIDLQKGELDYMRDPVKLAELRRRAESKVMALVDEEGAEFLDRDERRQVTKEVLDEALGLGPLEDLLADPDITEIMVNGPERIFVERKGKLQLSGVRFLSTEQLRGTIERIVAPIGRRIDERVPLVDARLSDGSRVNAIIPPLALDGPALTIRKFAKSFLGIDDLIRFGSLSSQMGVFLEAAVKARQNIIVSGGTGSGKTTLLNLLASYIAEEERVVTIEDSAELRLAQEHVVRLESRPPNIEGEGAITIRDLVRNALRMRPDRIVVGECRGGETLDMLQAMNTGHDGSLTTIHANTPLDALSRVETMCLMAGLDLPSRAIREQSVSAVNLIVQQSRLTDGSRRITNISEVLPLTAQGGFAVREVFLFKQTGLTPDGKVLGQFAPTGHVPGFVDLLSRSGIALPREIFLHQTA